MSKILSTKPVSKKAVAKKASTPASSRRVSARPRSASRARPPAAETVDESPADDSAVPEGSDDSFARFLPEARRIPQAQVRPFRGDAGVALHNVNVGLAAVRPHEAELRALPAPFDLAAMKSLHPLAHGLIYATAQVDRNSPHTLRPLVTRVNELRDVLLSSAVALMKLGVLPTPRVRKIMAGRGVRDAAQDCVDLANLFREEAKAVQGKTGITRAQIDEARSVGTQLLDLLKPKGVRARVSDSIKGAVDARDRLWTLLSQRHGEQLRLAGMWLWRDDVDDHVPALLSAPVKRAKKATKKVAKPTATASAAPSATPTTAPGDDADEAAPNETPETEAATPAPAAPTGAAAAAASGAATPSNGVGVTNGAGTHPEVIVSQGDE